MSLAPPTDASVLLADADSDTRSLYAEAFTAEGWTCFEAMDGRDALVQALTRVPSLCVAELWLPKIDGLALCQELRKDVQTERLPILIVTTDDRPDHLARATQAGASAVLVKPALPDAVVQTAAELIASFREARAYVERNRLVLDAELERSVRLRDDATRLVRKSRARAHRRYFTTTPDVLPPTLFCSMCNKALTFEVACYGGVNAASAERWDTLLCKTCRARYEYRFRTRTLRRVPAAR